VGALAIASTAQFDHRSGPPLPYVIYRNDGEPMAFAGLWEHWKDRERGEVIDSCAISSLTPKT